MCSPSNQSILFELIKAILTWGGLYILLGDFQSELEQLQEDLGSFLPRVRGILSMPTGPASCSSGRTIDGAIYHEALSHFWLSHKTCGEWDARQHRPHVISFRCGGRLPLIPVFRRPQAFPRAAPVLPSRDFKVDGEVALEASLASIGAQCAEQLDVAFANVSDLVEDELCCIFDMVEENGQNNIKYKGRHIRYDIVYRSAIPYTFGSTGAHRWRDGGLIQLASDLERYATLLRACHRLVRPAEATLVQLACARARLVRPGEGVRAFLSASPHWGLELQRILEMPEIYGPLAGEVSRLLACARRKVDARAKQHGTERCKGFWVWCEESLRSGGGGLFALSREKDLTPQAVASVGSETEGSKPFSALPADILSFERKGWVEVWGRHPRASAPWREMGCQRLGPPLPHITPEAIRAAAKSFPMKKGFTGFCARWFLFLSDEALWCVAGLLEACERLGLWPGAIRVALLHLIPKRGASAPLVW